MYSPQDDLKPSGEKEHPLLIPAYFFIVLIIKLCLYFHSSFFYMFFIRIVSFKKHCFIFSIKTEAHLIAFWHTIIIFAKQNDAI